MFLVPRKKIIFTQNGISFLEGVRFHDTFSLYLKDGYRLFKTKMYSVRTVNINKFHNLQRGS